MRAFVALALVTLIVPAAGGTADPGWRPGHTGYGRGYPGFGPGEPGYGAGSPGYEPGAPGRGPGRGWARPDFNGLSGKGNRGSLQGYGRGSDSRYRRKGP